MVSGMEGVNAVLPLRARATLTRAELAAQLAGATEAFLRAQGVAAEPVQAAEPPLASVSHSLVTPLLRKWWGFTQSGLSAVCFAARRCQSRATCSQN